ncbi:MAG: hypothetical protein H6557_22530 [Lewinellaceae bacterium]|nr:hypothetical protein [Phaeodactylibacter sp.]MCB9039402.1 hypothetical protein [Lewinellaceae bacterium]
MEGSRLLAVVENLSKKEVRELRKFLRSPFFNQREDVAQLFEFLTERVFALKINPAKEQAFHALYPGQPYNAQQVRYAMSWLLKAIELYLSLQPLLADERQQKIELAHAYREKRLPKHFQQTMQQLSRQQEQQPIRNAEYFEYEYRIQLEQYAFTASRKRISEHNLQEISDTIDLAFIARKLRQTCFLLSHQAVYKREYDFGLLEEALQFVDKKGLLRIPTIAGYYHCYHALRGLEPEQHFQRFKAILLHQSNLFPADEARDLFLLAINYCIRELNAGREAYAREGLDLYKEGFRTGMLVQEGQITRFTYRNAVAMALKEGELQWAEIFIREYKNRLPKEHRESMYSFSLARLAYVRQQYGKALEYLQRSEYQDLLLNLAAKTLMIKAFYELEEFDTLESHLDAMKVFLRRKDIIGYHRRNYRNIIRYTQKLLHLNWNDRGEVEGLRKTIEAEEVLTEREWLLEQVGGR